MTRWVDGRSPPQFLGRGTKTSHKKHWLMVDGWKTYKSFQQHKGWKVFFWFFWLANQEPNHGDEPGMPPECYLDEKAMSQALFAPGNSGRQALRYASQSFWYFSTIWSNVLNNHIFCSLPFLEQFWPEFHWNLESVSFKCVLSEVSASQNILAANNPMHLFSAAGWCLQSLGRQFSEEKYLKILRPHRQELLASGSFHFVWNDGWLARLVLVFFLSCDCHYCPCSSSRRCCCCCCCFSFSPRGKVQVQQSLWREFDVYQDLDPKWGVWSGGSTSRGRWSCAMEWRDDRVDEGSSSVISWFLFFLVKRRFLTNWVVRSADDTIRGRNVGVHAVQ